MAANAMKPSRGQPDRHLVFSALVFVMLVQQLKTASLRIKDSVLLHAARLPVAV